MTTIREKRIGVCCRAGRASLLCLQAVLAAGCSDRTVLEAVPAQWNPSYYSCLASAFDRPTVMNEAYYRLGARASSLEYWQLCRMLIDEADDADHVIIVEQLPEEHPSQYWYILILVHADKGKIFTGGTDPFALVDFGKQAEPDQAIKGATGNHRPCRVDGDKLKTFLDVIHKAEVWQKEPSEVYAMPEGKSSVAGQAPVMIHLFRRSDGCTVEFLLADPVVTPPSIRNRFDLGVLTDPSQAWFGASRCALQDIDPADQQEREQLFRRSLPARCVLNGALMLLLNGRE